MKCAINSCLVAVSLNILQNACWPCETGIPFEKKMETFKSIKTYKTSRNNQNLYYIKYFYSKPCKLNVSQNFLRISRS